MMTWRWGDGGLVSGGRVEGAEIGGVSVLAAAMVRVGVSSA